MGTELAERIEKVERERDRYRQLYLEALERCRMLEKGLIGQKSEKMPNDAQLTLEVLSGLLQAANTAAAAAESESESEPQPQPEPEPSKPADAADDDKPRPKPRAGLRAQPARRLQALPRRWPAAAPQQRTAITP